MPEMSLPVKKKQECAKLFLKHSRFEGPHVSTPSCLFTQAFAEGVIVEELCNWLESEGTCPKKKQTNSDRCHADKDPGGDGERDVYSRQHGRQHRGDRGDEHADRHHVLPSVPA